MDPNVRYRCEACGHDVRNARFRFCRSCELKSTPVHQCPGCNGPCRGKQCRQCHKRMYADRFCTRPDCYGKRIDDTFFCNRCITDMHREQQPPMSEQKQLQAPPPQQQQQQYHQQPPPSPQIHNPFQAYQPPPNVSRVSSQMDMPEPSINPPEPSPEDHMLEDANVTAQTEEQRTTETNIEAE